MIINPYAFGTLQPPPKPASLDAMQWSGVSHARSAVATRQTALEPIAGGSVDKALSWSCWIKPYPTTTNNRVFGTENNSTGDVQYALSIASMSTSSFATNRFSLTIYGTFPGVFIRITSTEIAKRNRWQHITVTYDGSETSAGLKMYINGVLDSTATKDSAGSYTGAFGSSNLRFFGGTVQTASNAFAGSMRDLAIWNKELSALEVAELCPTTTPIDVTAVSFYGSAITAFWPLHTTTTCANSSTFDLASPTNISSVNQPIGYDYEPITHLNAYPSNTRYVAFGGLFKAGNQFMWQGRSGTTHRLDGYIIKAPFDVSTLKAGTLVSSIISDGTYDVRGGSAGVFNDNQIINFAARYDGVGDVFQDLNRWESTDGLVGEAFGSRIAMTNVKPNFNFYGKIVPGYVTGEYFQPQYEHNGTTSDLYVWKYSGGSWSRSLVNSSSSPALGETAILRAGENRFILLCRGYLGANGLYQISSTDGGATWSSPTNTGLTAGQAMADMCLDPYGRIIAIWGDRATGSIRVSKDNFVNTILSDPTNWQSPQTLISSYSSDSYGVLGYPSIVRDNWNYAVSYSLESSASKSDLYFAYGRLD